MNKRANTFLFVYGIFLLITGFIANGEQLSRIAIGASTSCIFFAFAIIILSYWLQDFFIEIDAKKISKLQNMGE